VILDIITVETVSLSIIRNLRKESDVPFVMLSSDRSEEYFLEANEAGVDKCILKPFSPSLFHAKIKTRLRRSWSIPMDALDPLIVGNVHLRPAERSALISGGAPIHLTHLEMRLLYILMNRASRTVADEELIQRVWGIQRRGGQHCAQEHDLPPAPHGPIRPDMSGNHPNGAGHGL